MSHDQPYRYATTEADFTGLLGAITRALEDQSPWQRCTLSALTPGQAAERIGRDLFAEQARRFAHEVMTTGHGFIPLTYPVREPSDISPTGLWWLSFVDDTKSRSPAEQVPGAGGFLGVCIVQADHFMAAITISHRLGCNPGGQVQGYPTDAPPHPAWMNRLLSAADIDHIDAIEAELDTAQTAELLGRGLWEHR
ncbi:hypothetical protein [Nocardia cerradoensis]|uniref:Uncharacterized protein n=1 Tax=Nocardia cerradoensis TaxID=85688 RepID=A0A231GSY2_9NOCA|nr:hypothetical protein [Nocardia cerradoensis]NKY47986.1 hypothetical protein [Nocardia cerradoensis]OXR39727.1 hypothetical protein B7C42_08206 [Nocardia cerradoensis]